MKIPVATVEKPLTSVRDPEIDKVSKQFEAIFLNQLVESMRKTLTGDGFVPQSHAEKVYQSMLDFEYAQTMADTEQIGLSKLIYDHLLRKSQGE